jgi:hypothetical protein
LTYGMFVEGRCSACRSNIRRRPASRHTGSFPMHPLVKHGQSSSSTWGGRCRLRCGCWRDNAAGKQGWVQPLGEPVTTASGDRFIRRPAPRRWARTSSSASDVHRRRMGVVAGLEQARSGTNEQRPCLS